MRIGFGCVNLGSALRGRSFDDDIRLVRDAIDQGVRVFDTAGKYGAGISEQILGRAVGSRRDEVTGMARAHRVRVRHRRRRSETAGIATRFTGLRRAKWHEACLISRKDGLTAVCQEDLHRSS